MEKQKAKKLVFLSEIITKLEMSSKRPMEHKECN